MTKQIRINFIGGPSSGKSAAAHRLFGELRRKGVSAHLVREWVKDWAIEGRKPVGFDQLAVIGNQFLLEETALRANYEVIVNESALWVNMFYTESIAREYVDIVKRFDRQYPALNYFIHPVPIPTDSLDMRVFEDRGRFQTLQESIAIHNSMFNLISQHKIQFKALDIASATWIDEVEEDIKNARKKD